MSNLELIERLADLLGRAAEIIREQADLLAMHGVTGEGLEGRRETLLGEVDKLV